MAVAALLGAACVVCALPNVGWGWPIVIAWTPLLRLGPRMTWKQRLLSGWLMGFLYQAVLFRWIVFTAREMSGLPEAVGLLLLALFAGWHGLMCGVSLALAEPARRAAERLTTGAGPVAVATVFGEHGVSIRSMEQEGMGSEARLVFITHGARERDVRATLQDLRSLEAVRAVGSVLRVIGD